MKIISPIICQKLFAGLAIFSRSTTTLFHRYFPMKPIMTRAITKATMVARKSTYASRRRSDDVVPMKPSTVAFAAAPITPDILHGTGKKSAGRGVKIDRAGSTFC